MRKRLRELNYYELLSVPADAPFDRIKAAFHAFARKYHPDRAETEAARERFDKIYRRGTEAYRVLTDERTRAAYDAGLPQGLLRYDPSDPAVRRRSAGVERRPVSGRARPFLAQAQRALSAGDYQGAKLHLKMALGHDRDHPELLELMAQIEQNLSEG